jgi:hypothetical protein
VTPDRLPLPPWMLWTAVGLAGAAVLGLAGGAWRAFRRRPVVTPPITFRPLPTTTRLGGPPGSGRLPAGDPPDGTESRVDFRRPGNAVAVLVADAAGQPWNAWVLDRSRNGLRLAVERPLLVGSVYTARPTIGLANTPWTAFEVRHCAEVDGHWEAGCRFLQRPPVTVLMQFG